MFRVGQKVVFIGSSSRVRGYGCEILPEIGSVYTIRDINDHGRFGIGLRLAEIKNEPRQYSSGFVECDFNKDCFRPVVEKSTDAGMAILKEILERETISDRAPARQSS